MAKILAFRSVELKRVESGGFARGRRSAEVIFFPGVRYERWSERDGEPRQDGSSPKRVSRQRDILELAE